MIDRTADAVLLHTLNGESWEAIKEQANAGEIGGMTVNQIWDEIIDFEGRGLLTITRLAGGLAGFALTEDGKRFVRTMLAPKSAPSQSKTWGTW